jgi:tetratricopeptide (TPR) repeat protein
MNTLNDVLEFVINEPDKLNIIGEMLLELDADIKAEEIFRIARIKDPKSRQLASNLFSALYKQKKFDESILFCNQILEESPNDIQFLVNRSSAFIRLGKFELGLADCDKVLGLDETIGLAYYNKACVNSLQNNKMDTLQMLQKAIDYDPRSKEIAKSDEDFENLKNDSEFRKLVD